MSKKQELIDFVISNEFITKPSLQEQFKCLLDETITEQLRIAGVSQLLGCQHSAVLVTGKDVGKCADCGIEMTKNWQPNCG